MKKEPIDRATPTLNGPDETVEQKIQQTRTVVGTMQKSDEWPLAPKVQEAAADWSDDADALDQNHKHIAALLTQLQVARALEASLLRRWGVQRRHLLAAVDTHCDGSKDKVHALGCDVAVRQPRPLATVPEGLHGKRSEVVGRATAQWTTHRGEHNTFLVQYATNRDDPSTYSAPIPWTRGTFELDGQTPGAMIDFRVAAVDARLPGGQTQWTHWVGVRVSA